MLPNTQIEIDNFLVFSLLTLSFFLIGILRAYYWKHTKLLILASFRYRYASQYLRQDNAFTERVNWITFIVLLINFSLLFLYKNNSIYLLEFIIVVSSISFYYLLKFLVIKFLGKLLFIHDVTRLTVFFSYLSDKSLAIIIFPLILVLYFLAFDINLILINLVFIVGLIFLLFKSFWIWRVGTNSFGISSFYIFLYLCILELPPFVLITKGFFY
ncbi:MAG: DUF4271 domain-containing protein [Flavobacteriales bacterium]|jgi:hypothetical protein|nr:DUF4271 domain-containing protein [Flavobacteriales bacterium]